MKAPFQPPKFHCLLLPQDVATVQIAVWFQNFLDALTHKEMYVGTVFLYKWTQLTLF